MLYGRARKRICRAFGLLRGTIAAYAMRSEFYQPKRFRTGQAHVSFVAVRERARGHHLAGKMLEVLLRVGGYRQYTLDVVEGNEKVIPIYEGVGFEHAGRHKEKAAFLKGFSYRYLMEYQPEK
ncbi:MAG: GNAT family N-acetyltransferase [Bacillota bacterium]|nr:GNAT family N-acetyltransferase [Bacillota bacterium]